MLPQTFKYHNLCCYPPCLIRNRIEAKNQPLDNIFIYKHCAVSGHDGYWYRALVEKTPDKGKV